MAHCAPNGRSPPVARTVKAKGADRKKIEEAASAAKVGCPISKVLNLEITLELDIEA